ncbi:SDR family oxidoreductase [Microcoleus sp. N3A4]|uniref:SDR family oxidoreductase n=1 Tax=Microcoleus sp. N3A4 TaxID=3055379 RepID=UPI002FD74AE3
MFYSREFEGKVALVTGGSSGIGKATAFAFAWAGANVVVASRRVAEGQQTVHEICERGGDAIFVKTDVSKATEVEALVNKTMDVYGRLDCAFNNAGVTMIASLTDSSETEWDDIVNVNLKGTWLCLKYEIPVMLKQSGGAIVNMASIAGIVGTAGISIYSASKGGVTALSKAAAIEYANSGIRINTVSPAIIKTGILDNLPIDRLAPLEAGHPIGRIGQPEEVANAVTWLCSEKASFVTGHNMVIDGGYTAQ